MPIYQYRAIEGEKGCMRCSKGFELFRPLTRPALEVCPLCKTSVEKIISRVNTPKVAKPFSVSDAKKAGFTVLEKRDEGVYERQ